MFSLSVSMFKRMMNNNTVIWRLHSNELEAGRISVCSDGDIDGICVGAKPTDTKGGTCWSCFSCRRRSLTSKLTPIILQVIIVTVIWFVIRKTCYNSTQGSDVSVREIGSSGDQGVSILCNQGEFIKGSSLLFQDIVSVAGSLEPGQQQKRFFLQVDILTRNADQEKPTLYAVGTPVILDAALFAGKDYNSGKLSDKEKAEFYYENSLDEKDMDGFANENGAEEEKEGKRDRLGGEEKLVDFGFGDEKENINIDLQGDVKGLGQSNVVLQGGQGNGVVETGAAKTFQNANLDSESNNIVQPLNDVNVQVMQKAQMNVQPHGLRQNQQGGSWTPNQNIQQVQPGSEYESHLNPIRQQVGGSNNLEVKPIRSDVEIIHPGISNGQDQQRINNNNNNNNNLDQRPEYPVANDANTNRGSLSSNTVHNDNNEMSIETDHGQDINPPETLHVEGFKERLLRFKTEYYGRPVGESSDQTTTSYALNNPLLCESFNKIDVLFLINTIPQSNEQRQRIRDTFVKASLFQPFAIAHVFLVGLTSSPNFQGHLEKEHGEFGDVVQGEFSDKPETRTLKGLMGFRWVTSYCPKARFVFKLDEDVFVDTDKLLQGLIPSLINVIGDKAMLCFFVQNASIPRSGPNAFDSNIFPRSPKMRPYCKGFSVLTTVNTISSLVAASEHVPVFQFDELYLYGILPFVAGGVEVYDLGNKRAFHDFGMAVVNCYKDLQDRCPYVATKAFSSRFTSLWEFVMARQAQVSNRLQGDPSLWNIAAFKSDFYS